MLKNKKSDIIILENERRKGGDAVVKTIGQMVYPGSLHNWGIIQILVTFASETASTPSNH